MPKAKKVSETTPNPNVIEYVRGTDGNGEEIIVRLLSGILNQLKEMNYYMAKQVGEDKAPPQE